MNQACPITVELANAELGLACFLFTFRKSFFCCRVENIRNFNVYGLGGFQVHQTMYQIHGL
jgi:hypothetical protein